MQEDRDEFYYLTVMNESYAQPSMPEGIEEDIVRGLYRLNDKSGAGRLRLLGSGAILREVIAAAEMLRADWQVEAETWSVTSFSELARDARETERWNRLHPESDARASHLDRCLTGSAPVVAATDYVRAYPQLIASYVHGRFIALGTDGFGRSDRRSALRAFFEVDRNQIVIAALDALAREQQIPLKSVAQAIEKYGIDAGAAAPWER
jgi:pyruvate dehydrogenase E1 component